MMISVAKVLLLLLFFYFFFLVCFRGVLFHCVCLFSFFVFIVLCYCFVLSFFLFYLFVFFLIIKFNDLHSGRNHTFDLYSPYPNSTFISPGPTPSNLPFNYNILTSEVSLQGFMQFSINESICRATY